MSSWRELYLKTAAGVKRPVEVKRLILAVRNARIRTLHGGSALTQTALSIVGKDCHAEE